MAILKKSRSIKLAATTFSLLALTACGEDAAQQVAPQLEPDATSVLSEQDGSIFHSEEECAKVYDIKECANYRLAAKSDHDRDSPKYATQEECELGAHHDKCTPITLSNGAQIFAPAMVGFMVGAAAGALGASAIKTPVPVYMGRARDCSDDNSDRDCRRSRGVYTGRGAYVGNTGYSSWFAGSPATVSRPSAISSGGRAVSAPAVSSSVARGGFGASAGAHAGGGGE